MHVKVDKGQWKQKILESLTDRELAGLIELLGRVRPLRNPPLRKYEYLANFDTNTLVGVLHKHLFGFWETTNEAFRDVLENIEGVQKILAEIPLKDYKPETGRPKLPDGLSVCNKEAGTVPVSIHAWERFCDRWYPEVKSLSPDRIAVSLQNAFVRAKKEDIGIAYATLRTINNQFKRAEYFFDQAMNCRFVVVDNGGKFNLATVEHPKSKSRKP